MRRYETIDQPRKRIAPLLLGNVGDVGRLVLLKKKKRPQFAGKGRFLLVFEYNLN